jgi:thioredoxin-related protein
MKALIITLLCFTSLNILSIEWETNFKDAQQKAKAQNKLILMIFEGSDWCSSCMKLKKRIIKTKEFENYIQNKYIPVKLDFPRKRKNRLTKKQKEHNKKLASIYNNQGYFPLIVITNKNGDKITEIGYEKVSPTDYIDKIESKLK